MKIEALVAHRATHALFLAVLPGAARVDGERVNLSSGESRLNSQGDKLSAVITAEVLRRAVTRNQRAEHRDYPLGRRCFGHGDGQSLPGELVHHH